MIQHRTFPQGAQSSYFTDNSSHTGGVNLWALSSLVNKTYQVNKTKTKGTIKKESPAHMRVASPIRITNKII